jgi:aldehyde:ferredoxin oxidoreductase
MIMPGPFSGFPVPYAARFTTVTKSPHTSPLDSPYEKASTISFSTGGGFLAPEIKLAGYDGIIFTGKADAPVIVVINNDKVEIRDGRKYWGMQTYACEKRLLEEELQDRRYEVCSIGPAAENGVTYSGVLHSLGRAAGRGGTGTVMASKNLKAVAVQGSRLPEVADHKLFLTQLAGLREDMKNRLSRYGTAAGLVNNSDQGRQAVKNYREGTDLEAVKISGVYAETGIWTRHIACYCCPQACKKIGVGKGGKWGKWVVEGPEYESGTMFGPNLLVHDINGMMVAIGEADDLGFDHISLGNVLGFLMECYEKGLIDKKFTDGIDLTWGNVQGIRDAMQNIAYRKGNLGATAYRGTKHLAQVIGKGSEAFACHCKGHGYAAHNVHVNPPRALCYVTANRGACHVNGQNIPGQHTHAMDDSTVLCQMGSRTLTEITIPNLLQSITGQPWDQAKYEQTGERIFNLEKCFNYREGFRREDDQLPDRFYTEPLTVGPYVGAVLTRDQFRTLMDGYYTERGWDLKTTRPSQQKLAQLGLDFAWKEIAKL